MGPTLVAMATKFGLGSEIQTPTGLSHCWPLKRRCALSYRRSGVLNDFAHFAVLPKKTPRQCHEYLPQLINQSISQSVIGGVDKVVGCDSEVAQL